MPWKNAEVFKKCRRGFRVHQFKNSRSRKVHLILKENPRIILCRANSQKLAPAVFCKMHSNRAELNVYHAGDIEKVCCEPF